MKVDVRKPRFKTILINLILVMVLYSCSSYEGFISKADMKLKAGDMDKALVFYEKAIKSKPHKAKAYYKEAQAWADRGNYELAVELLDKAFIIEREKISRKGIMNYLLLYKYAFVEQIYKSPEFDWDDYETSISYLRSLENSGQTNMFNMTRIMNLKHDMHLALARNALSMGRLESAVQHLDQVIVSIGTNVGAFTELYESIADFFISKNDYSGALYFLDKVKNLSNFKAHSKLEDIYRRFATKALNSRNYEAALLFSQNLIIFSDSQSNHALKENVLSSYASYMINKAKNEVNLDVAQKYYKHAIYLVNQMEKPGQLSIHELYFDLSKVLFEKKEMSTALGFLDRVQTSIFAPAVIDSILQLRIQIYLSMAKSKLLGKEYLSSLDYANKILAISPEHNEAHKIKSEISKVKAQASFAIGSELFIKKEFEIAEYFIKKSMVHDKSFTARAKLKLSRLYEKSFLLDKAILALEEYNGLDDSKKYGLISSDAANFEIARMSSMNGEIDNAFYYLNRMYSSVDYGQYRETAWGNSDFFNLKDKEFFQLWVNGKKRMKIDLNRFTDIADLDFGIGISDPRLIIQTPSYKLWSYVYKERESVSFDDMYIIDDFNIDETVYINIVDYDQDEFMRSSDDPLGYIEETPFSREGSYYSHLYLDNNYHGTFHYSMRQTNGPVGFSGLFSDDTPRFQYTTGIYGRSCFQIVLTSGYDLLRTELSFYPYLLASIVHWFHDNSIDATNDRINEVAVKYLKTHHAPENLRFVLKRTKQMGILAKAINDLSSSNCL